MKTKTKAAKIKRDEDGYEYGGPDLSKMRRATPEERERILSKARRGPVKRLIDRLTA